MPATNSNDAAPTNQTRTPVCSGSAVPRRRVWRQSLAAFRTAATLSPLLILTSCTIAPDGEQRVVDQPTAPASSGPLTGGSRLELDSGHSWLTIRVYREGPLAKLGHNHVIRAPMRGVITMPPVRNQHRDPSSSTATRTASTSLPATTPNGITGHVWIDVSAMLIDDPAARAAAGSDFSSLPTARDIEGTGANMRSKALLNAAAFPRISADFSWPHDMQPMRAGNANAQSATPAAAESSGVPCTPIQIAATVAGRRTAIQVCADIVFDRSNQVGRAQFTLRQTDLGLTPFAVFGGALRVADEMHIAVDISALRPGDSETSSHGARLRELATPT